MYGEIELVAGLRRIAIAGGMPRSMKPQRARLPGLLVVASDSEDDSLEVFEHRPRGPTHSRQSSPLAPIMAFRFAQPLGGPGPYRRTARQLTEHGDCAR